MIHVIKLLFIRPLYCDNLSSVVLFCAGNKLKKSGTILLCCCFTLFQVYGGVYPEDKKWYRCRVKELVDDNKVPNSVADPLLHRHLPHRKAPMLKEILPENV